MSNYYAKRNAKVNIANELMNNGWKVFGYKADESDSMTDYYNPANWDGIATKNGFTLVVDTKYTGNSGRVQTRTTSTGSTNYKKIAKLEKMTIENGCTEAEAEAAKEMINKLKNNVKVNEEVINVWPEFMVNPKGCIWHIEKDGAIVAKGRSLTIFADVPESYIFDIKTMEFKGSWKTVRDWNGNTYNRELNEREAKAVKAFKEFLNKIESVVAVKIGEEQEEDQLVKVTEEKTTIKKEKIQVNRENELQIGDIVHVDSSTGYVKILEVFEGHYNTIKVSGRTWKESKSRFPHVNLNKQSFDRSLQRGYLKVYNVIEVEEVTTVEKWVKAKKKNNKTVKPEVKTTEEATQAADKVEVFANEEIQIIELKNTTRVYFNGKPSEEIRNGLKSLGFRFFKNDGFYWGNYSNKVNMEALKTALQIEEAAEEAPEAAENNNSISEAEAMEIIKNAEEYKNQILKEELGELEKEIQPLEFKEVESNNIVYLNDVEIARKPSDISDIKEFSELENILIDKYAILSNEDFDFMCDNLMNDYDFISGLGGSRAEAKEGEEVPEDYDIDYIYKNRNKFNFYEVNILITNEEKDKFIVVNPHGHSYCRYAGILSRIQGRNVLKQLTEGKADKLQLIETENTNVNNDNMSNIEKCENLHSEIEALENRLKMVNSQKLKYKIQEQINNKTKEMANIIYNDKGLYSDFLKYQK